MTEKLKPEISEQRNVPNPQDIKPSITDLVDPAWLFVFACSGILKIGDAIGTMKEAIAPAPRKEMFRAEDGKYYIRRLGR
jgi:hypothetical protein